LKLSDYNIKRPQLVLLKLDDNIRVSVDLFGTTAKMMTENPCNPCAANPCNPCAAGETLFTVDDDRNTFTFESKAPLEKIIGMSNKIAGRIRVDPTDVTSDSMAKFELHLASMSTGIGLRDEHMREQFLETDKYPNAVLTIDKVTKASSKTLMDQKPVTLDAKGTLELHGVKKKVHLEGITLTLLKENEDTKMRMPGDLIHIDGALVLKLSDYNIKRPQLVLLKLDDNIRVSVDLFGTTAKMMTENPCNPCAANPCNPVQPL
jgi:polyisoprenoid-binding protein YceI